MRTSGQVAVGVGLLCLGLIGLSPRGASSTAEGSEPRFREGSLSAVLTQGSRTTEFRYHCLGTKLRIEDIRETVPSPPYNIVDLETGDYLVVFRQNGTWMRIPAERLASAPTLRSSSVFPSPPPMPAGVGMVPGVPPSAISKATGPPPFPNLDAMTLPSGIGPRFDPETAAVRGSETPPEPGKGVDSPICPDQMPALPPGIGPRAMPSAGGNSEAEMELFLPPMPSPPDFPDFGDGANAAPQLAPTDERRTFLGFDCTLYTLEGGREGCLEAWVTSDLGPFHFRTVEVPQRAGGLCGKWVAMLRNKGLFPLLAIVTEEEHELLRFEVTAFERGKPDRPKTTFEAPPDFHELEFHSL